MDQDIKLSGPFLSASCHDDKGLTLEALNTPPMNRTATKTDVLGLRGAQLLGRDVWNGSFRPEGRKVLWIFCEWKKT